MERVLPVGVPVIGSRLRVADAVAPIDKLPVAVLLGVIVPVIVTEGEFVICAVTVVLIVADAVFVAVLDAVIVGVPVAVPDCEPDPVRVSLGVTEGVLDEVIVLLPVCVSDNVPVFEGV